MDNGRYDVIIIGGGHNGLICAAYLAKAGAKVLVLEKRPIVGGACVTEEPWPGFKINTFSYVCGMLRENIIDDLDLKRLGYDPVLYDPQYFVPFPDRKYLMMWVETERTIKEIGKFSKKDALKYPKYAEFFEDFRKLLEPSILSPPVSIKELFSIFEDPDAEDLLRRLLLRSAKDFLDEWFESDEVKTALCAPALVGAFAGPRTPGTAFLLTHDLIGTINGQHEVWGLSRGGMGMITQAIGKSAINSGAQIRVNCAVEQILVSDEKVTGVLTSGGEKIEARMVASGVDANLTFNHLLGPDNVSKEIIEKVNRIKYRGASLKFNAALSELPDFSALPGKKGEHHNGLSNISVSLDYMERAYDDAKFGNFSKHPFIEMSFQSVLDPTAAPSGKHTMTCFVQYVPEKFVSGSWTERKTDVAETIITTLEEYAPNIRKAILHRQLLGPEDFESILGLTGGSIFQGDMTPDQLFSFRPMSGWHQYRMPVKGLYLCGSAAHPGGGVMGAPGYLAASAIIEDLKKPLLSA